MKHIVIFMILSPAIVLAEVYPPTDKTVPHASFTVTFETNSATLLPAAKAALKPAIQNLRYSPKHRFRLVGHTDARGSRNDNQALSVRRAHSVKDYLIEQGVHPARIKLSGVGETRAAVNILDKSDLVNDRKVEIQIENANVRPPVIFASQ